MDYGIMDYPNRTQEFVEQLGYLTIVQNSETVDYLRLAYLQALSIKLTQKSNKYAIIVDEYTKSLIKDHHRRVFDYIIDIPYGDSAKDQKWKLNNEWKVWWCTPFKETIKLDSDMLFTRPIDHWIHQMRKTPICIATNVLNYRGEFAATQEFRKYYRKFNDDNCLIDAYSGFSYFRYDQSSMRFFEACKTIFEHWEVFRDKILKNCRHNDPTTDHVYAIAANMIGEELCYVPTSDFPSFVHMKGQMHGWVDDLKWYEVLQWTLTDDFDLIVGGYLQTHPFHYVDKDWATDELISRYEKKMDIQSV